MPFPPRTHHICLVSEQTLPNYLGAIVPEASPKQVHLIVTSRMKERADILQKALEARGCKVHQYNLAQAQPNPMIQVLDMIYEKTGTDVAVNVTGGTKVMALTAVEWAAIQDEPPFLFYVDTDNRQILQIGGEMKQYAMDTAVKLKELLKVGAGVNISTQNSTSLSAKERDILERLVQVFLKEEKALNLFNKCAKEAESSLSADLPGRTCPGFRQALDIAQEADKLRVTARTIRYNSEGTRFWCNGGWLEEFVQARLFKLKSLGLLDDWACNIEIFKAQEKGKQMGKPLMPQNEIDAAFTAGNRFFAIECKTANLAQKGGFSTASYKLDSLRRNLGGVLSRGMIVSFLKPRNVDIQRCKDLSIRLLYGADILQLEEKLISWIQ